MNLIGGHGHGGGGGDSTILPSSGRAGDGNITDGICVYAIIAFDQKYNYNFRIGNITIGATDILIPESIPLSIIGFILLPVILKRGNSYLPRNQVHGYSFPGLALRSI
jgi:hypothetical protein